MEESIIPRADRAPAGQEVAEPVAVMLPGRTVQGCTEAPEGRDRFAFELPAGHFPASHD